MKLWEHALVGATVSCFLAPGVLALSGCNATLTSPMQRAEQVDTANNNAYATFVTQINAALAAGSISQKTHDDEQRAAWAVLQLERTNYQAFKSVAP